MRTKEDIYRELHIPKDKESFKFSYIVPDLDWYKEIKIEIKPEDYYYFKLRRRYGPSWWLIGCNRIDEAPYWEEKEIGELGYENRNNTVKKFIEWAKVEDNGSRIIEISTLGASFDIIKEIKNLL